MQAYNNFSRYDYLNVLSLHLLLYKKCKQLGTCAHIQTLTWLVEKVGSYAPWEIITNIFTKIKLLNIYYVCTKRGTVL